MKISPKREWIGILTMVTGFVMSITAVLMSRVFDSEALSIGIACAIVFFFVYELITVVVIENKRARLTAKQMVNLYLGFKVCKILLSLMLAGIYAIAVKVELKRFILVFVLLYFIYLLFDTLYLTRREKQLKKNENK